MSFERDRGSSSAHRISYPELAQVGSSLRSLLVVPKGRSGRYAPVILKQRPGHQRTCIWNFGAFARDAWSKAGLQEVSVPMESQGRTLSVPKLKTRRIPSPGATSSGKAKSPTDLAGLFA